MIKTDDIRYQPQAIGLRLMIDRKRLGLTQTELARRIGCDRQTQMRYERGVRSIPSDYLIAAMAEGVDIKYVLFGVDGADVGNWFGWGDLKKLKKVNKNT
jgi:transcriptional regulator with XRE-family HTH domain